MAREMFFVFGSPRSGTTLLAQCLNAHDEIVIPYETDFIVPMAFVFDRIRNPEVGRDMIVRFMTESGTENRDTLFEYLTRDEIREAVHSCEYRPADVLNALYGRIADKCGKRLAGDKSPNDLLHFRMLIKVNAISPGMKIVHIVRDIRDIMVSVNHWWNEKYLEQYFPRFWCNSNLYLYTVMRDKPAQYHLVKYEDMVQAPERVVAGVSAFLGVEFQPAMLSPENRSPRYRSMPSHENIYRPIDPAVAGRHRSVLTREQLDLYERQASEALAAFGYPAREAG